MFKHYGGAKLASNYKKKVERQEERIMQKENKKNGEKRGKRKREKKNNGKGGKQDIIISIAILDLSVSLITIQPNMYLYTENLECSKYLLRCSLELNYV